VYICAYVHVYMRICVHIDIYIYAKYVRMIRVCVVRLYLSCTVSDLCIATFVVTYIFCREKDAKLLFECVVVKNCSASCCECFQGAVT